MREERTVPLPEEVGAWKSSAVETDAAGSGEISGSIGWQETNQPQDKMSRAAKIMMGTGGRFLGPWKIFRMRSSVSLADPDSRVAKGERGILCFIDASLRQSVWQIVS